jgi:hypothetical protein
MEEPLEIYFLRVVSNYFYPVKAYFPSMEAVNVFCINFIENLEFINLPAKEEFEKLSNYQKDCELEEMFVVTVINKTKVPDHKRFFLIDGLTGIKRKKAYETKHEGPEAQVQDAADDEVGEDGSKES